MPERRSKVLGKSIRPTFRLVLAEISRNEPLLFVCLKDSQGKKKTNLSVGLGGDKRDRTADLLNAIFGKEMESVGIWWNLEESGAI